MKKRLIVLLLCLPLALWAEQAPDVPAVKKEKCTKSCSSLSSLWATTCSGGYCYSDANPTKCSGAETSYTLYCSVDWTCLDKQNVLWTAEDGTKWCHKLNLLPPNTINFQLATPTN